MYREVLPVLMDRLRFYQDKTKRCELRWKPVALVPAKCSGLHDFYFTYGEFETKKISSRLAVFAKNHRGQPRPNLLDPSGLIMVQAPFGNADDLLIFFWEHLKDSGAVDVPFHGYDEKHTVQIIRGVVPVSSNLVDEAEQFNFLLNRELHRLFLLGVKSTGCHPLSAINEELDWLDNTRLVH